MNSAVGGQNMDRSLVRSVVVLTVCILATAALLLPVAIREQGTGNLAGLAVVTVMFLVASILSEAVTIRFRDSGSPNVARGMATAIRTLPPVVICAILAAHGLQGQNNFALVGYLFAFYCVTLVVEARLAQKRGSGPNPS